MKVIHLICIIFSFLFLNSTVEAQLEIGQVSVDTIDTNGETFESGGLANLNAAVQDGITSYNGFQYVGYYNNDNRLCLARRNLSDFNWSIIEFTDYFKTSEDAHNGISIGICPNDGTIHLAFDHHNDTLNYKVSVLGVANNPLGVTWDASLFYPVRDYLIPGQVSRITYPRFINTIDGNLQFTYRRSIGGAGNAIFRIADYDGNISEWIDDRLVVSNEGFYTHPLIGDFPNISIYNNQIRYDEYGTLHTTFTWREKKKVINGTDTILYRFNHDIGYLRSENTGIEWLNNDYDILANTNGEVVNYTDPGINVYEVTPEEGMINNQACAVDKNGIVHTIMNKADNHNVTNFYNFPNCCNYYHYYRNALGEWTRKTMPFSGRRGKMEVDNDNNLIFMFYDSSNHFNIAVASPECDYEDWKIIHSEYNLSNRFIYDSGRFSNDGVLSVLFQEEPSLTSASYGMPTPVFVKEYTFINNNESCFFCQEVEINPTDDIYVRGGIYQNDNFSSENKIAVKDNDFADNNRISYLKFDISSLGISDSSTVQKVILDLQMSQMSVEAHNTPYAVFLVEDNNWDEGTMTWNNQPISDITPVDAHYGRDRLNWNITALVKNKIEVGDQYLSVAIKSLRKGAPRNIIFHSKEAGNQDFHPKLSVQYNCYPVIENDFCAEWENAIDLIYVWDEVADADNYTFDYKLSGENWVLDNEFSGNWVDDGTGLIQYTATNAAAWLDALGPAEIRIRSKNVNGTTIALSNIVLIENTDNCFSNSCVELEAGSFYYGDAAILIWNEIPGTESYTYQVMDENGNWSDPIELTSYNQDSIYLFATLIQNACEPEPFEPFDVIVFANCPDGTVIKSNIVEFLPPETCVAKNEFCYHWTGNNILYLKWSREDNSISSNYKLDYRLNNPNQGMWNNYILDLNPIYDPVTDTYSAELDESTSSFILSSLPVDIRLRGKDNDGVTNTLSDIHKFENTDNCFSNSCPYLDLGVYHVEETLISVFWNIIPGVENYTYFIREVGSDWSEEMEFDELNSGDGNYHAVIGYEDYPNEVEIIIHAHCPDGGIFISNETRVNSTGVQNVTEQSNTVLFPNPSSGILNIEGDFMTDENTWLEIFDITGKKVFEKSVSDYNSSERIQLDLNHLSNGQYHLRIRNKVSYETHKVILLK